MFYGKRWTYFLKNVVLFLFVTEIYVNVRNDIFATDVKCSPHLPQAHRIDKMSHRSNRPTCTSEHPKNFTPENFDKIESLHGCQMQEAFLKTKGNYMRPKSCQSRLTCNSYLWVIVLNNYSLLEYCWSRYLIHSLISMHLRKPTTLLISDTRGSRDEL